MGSAWRWPKLVSVWFLPKVVSVAVLFKSPKKRCCYGYPIKDAIFIQLIVFLGNKKRCHDGYLSWRIFPSRCSENQVAFMTLGSMAEITQPPFKVLKVWLTATKTTCCFVKTLHHLWQLWQLYIVIWVSTAWLEKNFLQQVKLLRSKGLNVILFQGLSFDWSTV